MSDGWQDNGLQRVTTSVQELVGACTTSDERRIAYGNLRCECSDWKHGQERITNIAIIYETPGGSTCQVNVEYNYGTGKFSFLEEELEETVITQDPHTAWEMIRNHVRAIPEKRFQQLQVQIDSWIAEGKSRSQLFGEMNKLLQAEFLGGRISTTELKQGIRYALDYFSGEG